MANARPVSTPRTRTGCQGCRVRHLKCDENKPCSRCVKSGIECIRGYNIRFRHGANPSVNVKGTTKCDYDFADNQTWLRPASTLSFIDETKELLGGYDKDIAEEQDTTQVQEAQDDGDGGTEGERAIQEEPPTPLSFGPSPGHQQISFLGQSPASLPDLSAGFFDITNHRRSTARSESFGGMSFDGISSPVPGKRRKVFHSPGNFSATFHLSPQLAPASLYQSPGSTHNELLQHRPSITRSDDVMSSSMSAPLAEQTSNFDDIPDPTAEDIEAFSAVSDTFSKIYLDVPVWPLPQHEAHLLRHFVEHLAASFDLCDDARHFATVVPQRAAVCPTLLNAVLASSARHLSRISTYDLFISDQYHQKCLNHLIPMLSDHAAIMDENLLAATVILRFLEEIEVPVSGTNSQNHLLGTHVFISAQERSTHSGGLRQAAFWIGLRQEIYVAFVSQRSIAPALEHCNIDRSFDAADDCTWANRIVVHCADVIRFCFGDGERSLAHYAALCEYSAQWMLFKPPSFAPIYYREPRENDVFPEMWLLGDHVVCALQHHHLALILLAAHNPRVPRLGPGQKSALKAMDHDIKLSVLALCGIAHSNPRSPPAWVTACQAVAMCGERFAERREQQALFDVLTYTESEHAWPTGTTMATLREAWGWEGGGGAM